VWLVKTSKSKQKLWHNQKEDFINIRFVKPEIRILGIDDGVFKPHSKKLVDVVGVVYRGGDFLDGLMHTRVKVDGFDATEKLVEMITKSPHYGQLRVIMLNGITLAGFNIVDIEKLYRRTMLSVMAITREKPDFDKIKKALQNLPNNQERWSIIKKSGKILKMHTRGGEQPVYLHSMGLSEQNARNILRSTSTRSNIPEALRVAHIIASGLTRLD
jgi:endonuclease V-like protein UPF0215 family